MNRRLPGLLLCLLLLWPVAHAHPLAPALLELRQLPAAEGSLYAVQWRTSASQLRGGELEPRLPAGCQPVSAVQVAAGENQSIVQHWQMQCGAAGVVGRSIGISGLERSPINVILRIETLKGQASTQLLDAAQPSYTVPTATAIPPVFQSYLDLGVEHLLLGVDHVLFVIGLFLLVQGIRTLVLTITAFTLGHSITLALATLGVLSVPSALTELAIAASIVMLAYELARPRPQSLFRRRPWLMACAFGLLHGLGFAGALGEVGLPQGEIPLALLAFNIGIELGQLSVIALLALCVHALRATARHQPGIQRSWITLVPAYVIGSLAMYWCMERATTLLS